MVKQRIKKDGSSEILGERRTDKRGKLEGDRWMKIKLEDLEGSERYQANRHSQRAGKVFSERRVLTVGDVRSERCSPAIKEEAETRGRGVEDGMSLRTWGREQLNQRNQEAFTASNNHDRSRIQMRTPRQS